MRVDASLLAAPNWFRLTDTLIADRHAIRGENLQNAPGNGAAGETQTSVIEIPTGICAYVFNPERCFSLIGKSDPSAGKLRFDDSEHPFHRLCGTKE